MGPVSGELLGSPHGFAIFWGSSVVQAVGFALVGLVFAKVPKGQPFISESFGQLANRVRKYVCLCTHTQMWATVSTPNLFSNG